MKLHIIIFLFFCCSFVFNTRAESTLQKNRKDIPTDIIDFENKIKDINKLSLSNIDSAYNTIIYLRNKLDKTGDLYKMIIIDLCEAKILEQMGSYNKSADLYKSILAKAQKNKQTKIEIKALLGLGHTYSMKENLTLSLKFYLAGYDLATSLNDNQLIVESNLQLAEHYRKRGEYDHSLTFLNHARKKIAAFKLDISYTIRLYNRYAAVWAESNQHLDSVIIYSTKSLELAKSIGDVHSQALAYNEMGVRPEYFSLDERIEYHVKAKKIWSKLKYYRYQALPTIHLINIKYVPLKEYKEGIRIIKPLIEKLPNNCWERDMLLQQISGLHELNGNYKQALEANRERFLTFLTVKSETSDEEIEELTLKYKADKVETDLNKKEIELYNEKAEKTFFILMFVVAVIIAISIFIFMFLLRKKNKTLKQQKREITNQSAKLKGLITEKEMLLMEVNHRVKNNMMMISSVLEMQQETTQNTELKKNLQTAVNRVRSLVYAHQNLYKTENFTEIEINSYIELICENLLINSDVNLELDFEKLFLVSIEKAQAIGFVLNELITNSLKHAWLANSGANTKKISIHFSIANSNILIDYHDNGKGFEQEVMVKQTKSLGMMLINSFVSRQLNGKIKFFNNKGAQIKITCKKE